MAKNKRQLIVAPGPDIFKAFMKENGHFLNLSEMERLCEFPNGTLRQIRTDSRNLYPHQYKKLQETFLPKLCELVMILQSYGQLHQIPIEY